MASEGEALCGEGGDQDASLRIVVRQSHACVRTDAKFPSNVGKLHSLPGLHSPQDGSHQHVQLQPVPAKGTIFCSTPSSFVHVAQSRGKLALYLGWVLKNIYALQVIPSTHKPLPQARLQFKHQGGCAPS